MPQLGRCVRYYDEHNVSRSRWELTPAGEDLLASVEAAGIDPATARADDDPPEVVLAPCPECNGTGEMTVIGSFKNPCGACVRELSLTAKGVRPTVGSFVEELAAATGMPKHLWRRSLDSGRTQSSKSQEWFTGNGCREFIRASVGQKIEVLECGEACEVTVLAARQDYFVARRHGATFFWGYGDGGAFHASGARPLPATVPGNIAASILPETRDTTALIWHNTPVSPVHDLNPPGAGER